MTDEQLMLLLQQGEEHLRNQSCRLRYERSVVRLPDSRQGIRFKDEKRSA